MLAPHGDQRHAEPQFSAWVEWFPFPHTQDFPLPSGATLGPDDRVAVFVHAVNAETGYAIVKNKTRRWTMSAYATRPEGVTWQGASAEFVVERPRVGRSAVWLPEFTEVSIQECLAANTSLDTYDLSYADYTWMQDSRSGL
jgi:Peptidase A4 family